MIKKSTLVFVFILITNNLIAQNINCEQTKSLLDKLNLLYNLDQSNRLKMQSSTNKEVDSLWLIQGNIDKKNQQELIKLIEKNSFECVFKTNSKALETIISHTGDSIRINYFLPLLLENLKKGIGSAITYANLFDQMMVYSGKKQLYGMIICPDGRLCPIEDLTNINNRRKEIGLNSIEEYCNTKGLPNPLDTINEIRLEDYSNQMMKGMYVPAGRIIMNKLKQNNLSKSTKLDLWYNLACCFAHLTYYDESIEAIDSLVKYGYSDPYIIGDYTFNELPNYTNWSSYSNIFINNFKNENANIKNIELSVKLRIMLAEDQSTIGLNNKEVFKHLHQKHINTIKVLFSKNEDLSKGSIGLNSIDAISTIILHEEDITTQTNLYKYLYNLSNQNKFPWENTCIIYDKIQIRKGEKQLYGTQWYYDAIDNKSKPYPIEDIKNINKRRKDKGFKFTFEEYSSFQNSYK